MIDNFYKQTNTYFVVVGVSPEELGLFSHLESLWINGNQLSATLPPHIWGNLGNLTYLKMSGNNLSGRIPSQVGLLSNIKQIWFAEMPLTGTIPSEVGNMALLEDIFFHLTDLEGTVPAVFADLENLKVITLSDTSITGAIPEDLCDNLMNMELNCLEVLGVQEQVCTEVTLTNFSCSSSNLCGCDCDPCA